MAKLETIKVDIIQETIHAQIKKLAQTINEQSGVKLENVRISWYPGLGVPDYISNIDITTSMR